MQQFFDAIKAGRADEVRQLVAENPSLKEARDASGASAILVAAYNMKPDVVNALLEAGAPVDIFEASVLGKVDRIQEILKGSPVKASTTIGFPHGGHTTAAKLAETKQALADGGEELDMVVNISRVLSGDWDYVRADIKAVVDAAHAAGQKVKVIFENCYLKDEQKIRLCQICGELGADWVKTSTGFGTSGATLEDLALMRKHSPASVQVKAAGGVRDLDMLLKVRELGVTRCGARSTKEILDEAKKRLPAG